jgi:hypothetical protein
MWGSRDGRLWIPTSAKTAQMWGTGIGFIPPSPAKTARERDGAVGMGVCGFPHLRKPRRCGAPGLVSSHPLPRKARMRRMGHRGWAFVDSHICEDRADVGYPGLASSHPLPRKARVRRVGHPGWADVGQPARVRGWGTRETKFTRRGGLAWGRPLRLVWRGARRRESLRRSGRGGLRGRRLGPRV